jgi:biopolymer transport protein ExbD
MRRGLYSGAVGPRRRTADDDEIDITPMIDCVFLLLIFFMVTSTMQGGNKLTLPTARHGIGVNSNEAVTICVFNDDAGPGVYLHESDRKNGPVDVAEVGPYVLNSGKHTLIIKADTEVPSGFIEDVARAAGDAVEDLIFYVGITDKRTSR